MNHENGTGKHKFLLPDDTEIHTSEPPAASDLESYLDPPLNDDDDLFDPPTDLADGVLSDEEESLYGDVIRSALSMPDCSGNLITPEDNVPLLTMTAGEYQKFCDDEVLSTQPDKLTAHHCKVAQLLPLTFGRVGPVDTEEEFCAMLEGLSPEFQILMRRANVDVVSVAQVPIDWQSLREVLTARRDAQARGLMSYGMTEGKARGYAGLMMLAKFESITRKATARLSDAFSLLVDEAEHDAIAMVHELRGMPLPSEAQLLDELVDDFRAAILHTRNSDRVRGNNLNKATEE